MTMMLLQDAIVPSITSTSFSALSPSASRLMESVSNLVASCVTSPTFAVPVAAVELPDRIEEYELERVEHNTASGEDAVPAPVPAAEPVPIAKPAVKKPSTKKSGGKPAIPKLKRASVKRQSDVSATEASPLLAKKTRQAVKQETQVAFEEGLEESESDSTPVKPAVKRGCWVSQTLALDRLPW